MAEFVTIRNPSLPEAEPAKVTRQAFELIHKAKGWEVVEDAAPVASTPTKSLSISEQVRLAQSAPEPTDPEASPTQQLEETSETETTGDAPAKTPAKKAAASPRDGKEG